LSLPVVDVATINHVARVDEELGSPHGLEEITWSLHLPHELYEKLSTGICVNALHETVNTTNDTTGIRKSVVVDDGRIIAIGIWCDGYWINGRSCRSEDGYREVGRAVRHHAHGDEHDEEIEENGKVGQDSEFLECSHLADGKASDSPDETADGIAESELRDLRNGLAVTDDDVSNAEEQLKTLQEVDNKARDSTVNTESEIGIVLAWVFVGIETHEASPEKPARTDYPCQYRCD